MTSFISICEYVEPFELLNPLDINISSGDLPCQVLPDAYLAALLQSLAELGGDFNRNAVAQSGVF